MHILYAASAKNTTPRPPRTPRRLHATCLCARSCHTAPRRRCLCIACTSSTQRPEPGGHTGLQRCDWPPQPDRFSSAVRRGDQRWRNARTTSTGSADAARVACMVRARPTMARVRPASLCEGDATSALAVPATCIHGRRAMTYNGAKRPASASRAIG